MNKVKRKAMIAGNWKMNLTPAQAAKLLTELMPLVQGADCEVAVCVPYIDLFVAAEQCANTNILVGAQNCHWADKGAFTGEISAPMLRECGATLAIVGHSERRQYFGDTDESVNQRLKAVLAGGLRCILCVGESLDEREAGSTEAVVRRQVTAGLAGVTKEQLGGVIIAYEPIWAIGTGKTATSAEAQEVCGFIRTLVAELYDGDAAGKLQIQYGGSMNAQNAAELLSQPDIDGGLIGGASLKAQDFAAIVAAAGK